MNEKHNNHKITIILLWVVIMFNMIFADIFSVIIEIVDGNVIDIPLDATTMMGIAAAITNIPILMIILSWILPSKANRWANIVAAVLTIVYIIGGGSMLPHYYIIGGIEIILLLIIIVLSFKWKA